MEETFPKVDLSSAMERKLWHMQMKQMTALTSTLRRPPTSSSCQAKVGRLSSQDTIVTCIIIIILDTRGTTATGSSHEYH